MFGEETSVSDSVTPRNAGGLRCTLGSRHCVMLAREPEGKAPPGESGDGWRDGGSTNEEKWSPEKNGAGVENGPRGSGQRSSAHQNETASVSTIMGPDGGWHAHGCSCRHGNGLRITNAPLRWREHTTDGCGWVSVARSDSMSVWRRRPCPRTLIPSQVAPVNPDVDSQEVGQRSPRGPNHFTWPPTHTHGSRGRATCACDSVTYLEERQQKTWNKLRRRNGK